MNPAQSKPGAGEQELPRWYLAINNQPQGPMTTAQIADHVRAGQAGPKSMAWTAGMPDWQQASQLDELKSLFQPPALTPPPLTPPPLKVEATQGQVMSLAQAAAASQKSQPQARPTLDEWLPKRAKVQPLEAGFTGSVLNTKEQLISLSSPIKGDKTPKVEGTNLSVANVEKMTYFAVDMAMRVQSMLSLKPRHRIDVDMRPA